MTDTAPSGENCVSQFLFLGVIIPMNRTAVLLLGQDISNRSKNLYLLFIIHHASAIDLEISVGERLRERFKFVRKDCIDEFLGMCRKPRQTGFCICLWLIF